MCTMSDKWKSIHFYAVMGSILGPYRNFPMPYSYVLKKVQYSAALYVSYDLWWEE